MEKINDSKNNVRLFDRLPDGFFAPLSRKYKTVYSYALITLYQCFKIYESSITRTAYMEALKKNGQDIISPFSIDKDKDDDRDTDEEVDASDSQNSDKFAYVVRKLARCGWFQIDKDFHSGVDYIFLPPYSIKMLELIDNLTCDISTYMPLVHQIYSELKLEDEKEDDFMYRTLANAYRNSDKLKQSVNLLHHSIVFYKHRLTNVFNPNEALKDHFDLYKKEVGDYLYHPMKTYDSLGLYARPVVDILNKWLRDERIIARLASQARLDTSNSKMTVSEATDHVIKYLTEIIDTFNELNSSFNEIDKVNADYTEAVQKKVNYLSGSDKSIKGKLEKIISSLAAEISKNSNVNEDTSPLMAQMMGTINLSRASIFDSRSLMMPFKRTMKDEPDPMGLAPDISEDGDDLMNNFLNNEVSKYSEAAVDAFMRKAFGSKNQISTDQIDLIEDDDLILLILALVRAEFGTSFFTMEKKEESVINGHFQIPQYVLTKRKGA